MKRAINFEIVSNRKILCRVNKTDRKKKVFIQQTSREKKTEVLNRVEKQSFKKKTEFVSILIQK